MTETTKQQPLMTARQVADVIGVCEKTVNRMSMRLDFSQLIKVGRAVRFDPREIEIWIDSSNHGVKYKRPVTRSGGKK